MNLILNSREPYELSPFQSENIHWHLPSCVYPYKFLMVLSFAFKTFLTTSRTVSYSFHVVFLTVAAIIFLFISSSCIDIFLIICIIANIQFVVFLNFFATGFYFVLQLCIDQYTVSGLNQVPLREFLAFFYCVFLLLSVIWSYRSRWRCSLEPDFKFNK